MVIKKKYLLLFFVELFLIFPIYLFGQKYDTARLNKDLKLGEYYHESDQLDSALVIYESALESWKSLDRSGHDSLYWAKYVELLIQIGHNQFGTGDYDIFGETFRQAIKISDRQWKPTTSLTARAHLYYSKALIATHLLDSAQLHVTKAVKINERILGKSDYRMGEYYRVLGDLHGKRNSPELALQYYEQAVSIYNETSQALHQDIARLYYSLGNVYADELGDIDKGLAYHKKFLTLTVNNYPETHSKVGRAYEVLSVDYLYKGKFDESINLFYKALSIYKEVYSSYHPRIANVYNNLGVAFVQKGVYFDSPEVIKEALPYYEESLRIRREIYPKKNYYIATCLLGIGTIYQRLESNDQALDYLFQTIEILEDVFPDGHYIVGHIHNQIGEVFEQKGDFDQSTKYFREAIDLLRNAIPEKHAINAVVFSNFAGMYEQKGDYVTAMLYYQKALVANIYEFNSLDITANPLLSHRAISALDYIASLYGKATGYMKSDPGNIAYALKADTVWQLAINYVDLLRHSYKQESNQINIQKKSYEVFDAALENMAFLSDQTGDSRYDHRAFQLAEKSKAIVLQESLKAGEAIRFAGIPPEIKALEDSLRVRIAYIEKDIFEQKSKTGQPDSVTLDDRDKLFGLRQSYDSLVDELETNYPEYHRMKYAHVPATVSEIQQALTDKEAMIAYFLGGKSLHIYRITKNDFQVYSEIIGKDIHDELEEFIRRIKSRSSALEADKNTLNLFKEEANNWYERLLAPALADVASVKELIIIPDGMLCYLPFELLLTENSENIDNYGDLPYLFKDFRLRYSYAATLISDDLRRVHDQENEINYIGFAPEYNNTALLAKARGLQVLDSGVRAGVTFLKYNQPEVEDAASLLNGLAYKGIDATEQNFKKYATSSAIIHLSMHAFVNDENPMYSGLVFTNNPLQNTPDSTDGDDNFLHAFEIYNMKLRADLAVLSACNTGSGSLRRGEGVMSLSRAFHYAGCRNLVMSLWQADDQATYDIMQAFYKYLAKGVGKDQALQQAKFDYLQSHDQSHPYFWANFVVIGDNDPISLKENRWSFLALPFILLLSAILIFLVARKTKKVRPDFS